jgi:RNA polymerase sigma-B factor
MAGTTSCRRLSNRPTPRDVGVSPAVPAVTSVRSASSSPGCPARPTMPALWPQGRWQPGLRAVMSMSTIDTQAVHAQDALLARLGELAPGDARRLPIRARVIDWHLPMAVFLARQFDGRGEPMADLTQIAIIGLIKAVDRFDASRGVQFARYAIPTILGELKRHFRDTAWSVRVPRRVQELRLELATVTEHLAQVLHRLPTTTEIAAQLGVSPREVQRAHDAATAYRPVSVNQPAPGHDDLCLIDLLAVADRGIEAVDNRETLRVLLAALPARERRAIRMRFYADMTESQIASDIGVSQMHVSRLLTRSLTRLHAGMLTDAGTTAATHAGCGTRRTPTLLTASSGKHAGRSSAPLSPVFPPRG